MQKTDSKHKHLLNELVKGFYLKAYNVAHIIKDR